MERSLPSRRVKARCGRREVGLKSCFFFVRRRVGSSVGDYSRDRRDDLAKLRAMGYTPLHVDTVSLDRVCSDEQRMHDWIADVYRLPIPAGRTLQDVEKDFSRCRHLPGICWDVSRMQETNREDGSVRVTAFGSGSEEDLAKARKRQVSAHKSKVRSWDKDHPRSPDACPSDWLWSGREWGRLSDSLPGLARTWRIVNDMVTGSESGPEDVYSFWLDRQGELFRQCSARLGYEEATTYNVPDSGSKSLPTVWDEFSVLTVWFGSEYPVSTGPIWRI